MLISDKHKALLITLLISGTILLGIFNFHLKQNHSLTAEIFYDLEAEKLTPEELKIFEDKKSQDTETNKAFNETKKYKHFAQAYKLIAPPKDYEYKPKTEGETSVNINQTSKELNKKELSKFNNISKILEKQKTNEAYANTNSSMQYSLVNRTDVYLPIPIYLCEQGGKIVVNITVNSQGNVTNAYINTTSNSSNECLKEHALEYAKEAQFNADASKKSQIGSITFYFKGKN
jgi:TonB family protein